MASSDTPGSNPVVLPGETKDLFAFRQSDEGKKLVKWAKDEFSRCQSARTSKQRQWYLNMAMVFGHQWLDETSKQLPNGAAAKLVNQRLPRYIRRRTINRLRAYVRAEASKFLSSLPTAVAVPSTSEDEDQRSAYAAQQVWESFQSKRMLRREYSRALWWMIMTGNGFMKTWWDPTINDKTTGQPGDIVFKSITPFNIYVPDLREREIDDQPYIIQAQVKNLEWVKQFYSEELKGVPISPSTISANTLLDEAYLNLQDTPRSDLDSVVVLEVWVKPKMIPQLPNGGCLVIVEDTLVSYSDKVPYEHGDFPYTKFEHISNDSFYADSPLVDLIPLQIEYNELRTEISLAGRRMARPQLAAVKGSIDTKKVTNEPGQIIEYNQGTLPPTPIPLSPLPEYYVNQQNVILTDFEDISGQHEVSRGDAPPGVTAGTAISFLQEKDDQFNTPQYQNVEDGFERIAIQTLSLFQQYVDVPRKIKVIGSDGSFDTLLLSASDIIGGTDVRVEPGSSIGQSAAAKRAAVMEMFSVGIIQDPNEALRLLEVGGAQKILDIMAVAEKKAQRENTKMRSLTPDLIAQNREMYGMQVAGDLLAQSGQQVPMGATLDDVLPMLPPDAASMIEQMIPPVVQVDDFDDHRVHIVTHNKFRMGQAYESFPEEVKAQYDLHVKIHQEMLGQQFMQDMMMNGGAPAEDPNAPATSGPPRGGPDTMQAQGAASAPPAMGA